MSKNQNKASESGKNYAKNSQKNCGKNSYESVKSQNSAKSSMDRTSNCHRGQESRSSYGEE